MNSYSEKVKGFCKYCDKETIFVKIKENGSVYYACSGDLGKTNSGCGKIIDLKKEGKYVEMGSI